MTPSWHHREFLGVENKNQKRNKTKQNKNHTSGVGSAGSMVTAVRVKRQEK